MATIYKYPTNVCAERDAALGTIDAERLTLTSTGENLRQRIRTTARVSANEGRQTPARSRAASKGLNNVAAELIITSTVTMIC